MATHLPSDKVFTGFELRNMTSFSAEEMLASRDPEEVVMALLGNFEGKPAKQMIRSTIERLQEIAPEPAILNKFLTQLAVLSGLRKLDKETIKQIEKMALTIDIKSHYLYKRAMKEGLEKGIEQGIERGVEKGTEKMIERLLMQNKLTINEIAETAQVPVSKVTSIRKRLRFNR